MKSSELNSAAACILFRGLDEERLRELFDAVEPSTQCYERNDIIFSPGNFTRSLAVIISGSADVTKSSGSGTVYMSRLTRGSIFGMASLFYESEEYLTSVTAREKCRILFFSREKVDMLFRLEPGIGINYVTVLSERIHFLNKRIAEIGCPDAKEKLLQFLTLSCEKKENGEILLPCSRSSLASALSLGRTSLYRAFDALEAEGKIIKNGKKILMR